MNMTLVSTNIWPPNWDQFIPSIFATFIGFILALVGDYFLQTRLDKRKKSKEAKELRERLVSELNDVKKVLLDLDEYSLDKNPLKTPVWDEAMNAGMVSLMESGIRQKLFTVYKKINELNSWYEIKTNYYFAHFDCSDENKRYNNELNNEINKQVGQLLGTVEFDEKTPDSEKVTVETAINLIEKEHEKQE